MLQYVMNLPRVPVPSCCVTERSPAVLSSGGAFQTESVEEEGREGGGRGRNKGGREGGRQADA